MCSNCPGCAELRAKVAKLEAAMNHVAVFGRIDAEQWEKIKAAAKAEQLPPGVEIVNALSGLWAVRTATHWLGNLTNRWYARDADTDREGCFATYDIAFAAALKAPPPPDAETPAGDGLEAAVNGTLHAHWLATTNPTVGVRDAVVELIREQVAKATAELREQVEEQKKEHWRLLNKLGDVLKERNALAERLRAATRPLTEDEAEGCWSRFCRVVDAAGAARAVIAKADALRAGKEAKHGA